MTDSRSALDSGPDGLAALRDRLYHSYATTHAGTGGQDATAAVFARDFAPHLPASRSARIVDLGCGQGHLVRELRRAGYAAAGGIDVSPQQVELARAAGVPGVVLGDFREVLGREQGGVDALLATDFLEHLTKVEVLEALDAAHLALRPGGVLVARVPNAASPFGGATCFGDFTHETCFTPRSLTQVCRVAGFSSVTAVNCWPPRDTLVRRARGAVWRAAGGLIAAAVAAETGQRRGIVVTRNMVAVARKGVPRPRGFTE